MYKYVCLAIEPPSHLVRFHIPKGLQKSHITLKCSAGLQFIVTHATLLREYLTEDAELMFGRLSMLCSHINTKAGSKH